MHFHKCVLRLRLLLLGSRDRLIVDPVEEHLFLRDIHIDEIHQSGVPRLDHGHGVSRQQGVLLEDGHRLPPMSVGLVMDMQIMLRKCMSEF